MDATLYIFFFSLTLPYCYFCEAPKDCFKGSFGDHIKAINISGEINERFLNLSWNCSFPPEIKSKMEYRIYLKNDEGYHFKKKTEKCDTTMTLETLSAVCLKVIPAIEGEECQYLSSEKCINPESYETSAENVICSVYNTSSMTCRWMFGKNAPHRTSYILFLRQESTSIQCQQYKMNSQTRTGTCTFHDLRVDFFEEATIVLQGLGPGIEVFEEQIHLAHIEMFNPPRHISVTSFNDSITIDWEHPQTQYPAEDHCFEYTIEKNKNVYYAKSNSYTIPNGEKECSVRIRARGNAICQMSTQWGEWSKWIPCGPRPVVGENPWQVELIPVILVSGLILVLLIITTLQYKRIKNSYFPRIPQPKNYLESTEDCKINTENTDYFSSILLKSETEEYIVIKENF